MKNMKKKLGLAAIAAVGIAMVGMSPTAFAEDYLRRTGDDVWQWELNLEGLAPDEVLVLSIECGGELVEYMQGEPQADSNGEYYVLFFFEHDPEPDLTDCAIRVEGEVSNKLIPFALPATGSDISATLALVAALLGSGALLIGVARIRRPRFA